MASMGRKDFLRLIRDRIESEWPPGTKLPSTSQLQTYYGVGATLVNEAMQRLIESGEVIGHAGGARYVAGGVPSEHTGEIGTPPES